MTGNVGRKLIASILALVIAGALAWSLVWNYMHTPVQTGGDVKEFEVVQGASLGTVARSLAEQKMLRWPRLFAVWGRLTGSAGRIQAGVYELQPGMTLADILELMEQGKVRLYPVTILEGWNVRELLAELARNPLLGRTLDPDAPELAEVLAEGVTDSPHPEGRFFPDTYMVSRNTADTALLRQASILLAEKLKVAWDGRQPGLPLANPYELLILASLVESEAALDSERAQIAGVFVRRLQSGIRLQTDPSVIYGLGPGFDGNLTRKHLETDTPYNTYTRDGLPPTPIALPGEASLLAAAHPAPGKALYFVASGKGDGAHIFSATLAEHNAAVNAYIREQRKLVARQRAEEAAGEQPDNEVGNH